MSLLSVAGISPNLSAIGRRYAWTVGVVTLLAVTIGLLEGTGVTLLIPLLTLFNGGLGERTARAPLHGALGWIQQIAAGSTRNQQLVAIALMILGFVLLKGVVQTVANHFVSWIDGRVGHDIRSGLSRRLQKVGYSFFLTEQTSRLVNILTTESWRASDAVRTLLQRLSSTAVVAVISVLLVLVSWQLSLVVLCGGLLARLVQRRFESALQVQSERTAAVNETLADRMLFAIFGSRLIRLFHEQSAEQARFEAVSEETRRAILRRERVSGMQTPVLEVMHGALFLVVVGVAVMRGIPMPVLIAFLVLMNRMQPQLRLLEQSAATFASASAHLGEVEWLLSEDGKPAPPSGALPYQGLRTSIEFDQVMLHYGQRSEPALCNASFHLRRGRATALMGSSGAGKSSVINLLCRLVEPTSGTIRVNGQRLSETRVDDWLKTIAIAGQDIDLIDGTVAENVRYGSAALTDAEVEEALRLAQAEFVFVLPQGLETCVGHHGMSLSGGQRQRIGIARALARKPDILILDEATNALDHETESGVIAVLQALRRTLTLIVISHRVDTLAFCDDAIVLERGRVVGAGPLAQTSSLSASRAREAASAVMDATEPISMTGTSAPCLLDTS